MQYLLNLSYNIGAFLEMWKIVLKMHRARENIDFVVILNQYLMYSSSFKHIFRMNIFVNFPQFGNGKTLWEKLCFNSSQEVSGQCLAKHPKLYMFNWVFYVNSYKFMYI